MTGVAQENMGSKESLQWEAAGLGRVPQIPVSLEPVDVISSGNKVFAGGSRLEHGHTEVGGTLNLCDQCPCGKAV